MITHPATIGVLSVLRCYNPMVDRRFLVPAVAVLLIVSSMAAAVVLSDDSDGSFMIIHTNDTHCFYDGDGGVGFATVSALREMHSKDRAVFTVDAGDFLQGNSYGTMTDGEGSIEVMNTVGYDLTVPGNHEFDYGFDVFLERAGQLDFPVICANLVYGDTGASVFEEYLILERGGVKVGFFGLLTEETPDSTMAGNMGDSLVTDPIAAAERMVSLLKGEDVDSIVAVGHMGVSKEGYTTSDELCKSVPGIDIFIDGHSHTEMEDGRVCDGSKTLEESDTVIASTGCNLHNVGIITSDSKGISAKLYRGPALDNTVTSESIDRVVENVNEKLGTVIGRTEILLDGERDDIRNRETNLGDFAADAVRRATGADVAILNSGALRSSVPVGDITLKTVYDVMPFLNFTCTLDVPGSVLWDEMEFSLKLVGASKGGYLQFSGMTVTYDPDAEGGSRVRSIKVAGTEVDRDAVYKLATIAFVATGGDGNTYLQGYDIHTNRTFDVIFAEYIRDIGTVTATTIEGGRLVAVRCSGYDLWLSIDIPGAKRNQCGSDQSFRQTYREPITVCSPDFTICRGPARDLIFESDNNMMMAAARDIKIYNANDLARFIIHKFDGEGRPVDNLKLQKLLYFAWVDFYKETHRSLFNDRIEAWMYGPVVPSVYFTYRLYVAFPIPSGGGYDIESEEDRRIIEESLDKYGSKSVGELIRMTHESGTPWSKAYSTGRRSPISFQSIRDFCDASRIHIPKI